MRNRPTARLGFGHIVIAGLMCVAAEPEHQAEERARIAAIDAAEAARDANARVDAAIEREDGGLDNARIGIRWQFSQLGGRVDDLFARADRTESPRASRKASEYKEGVFAAALDYVDAKEPTGVLGQAESVHTAAFVACAQKHENNPGAQSDCEAAANSAYKAATAPVYKAFAQRLGAMMRR